jgi:hypothetical protein
MKKALDLFCGALFGQAKLRGGTYTPIDKRMASGAKYPKHMTLILSQGSVCTIASMRWFVGEIQNASLATRFASMWQIRVAFIQSFYKGIAAMTLSARAIILCCLIGITCVELIFTCSITRLLTGIGAISSTICVLALQLETFTAPLAVTSFLEPFINCQTSFRIMCNEKALPGAVFLVLNPWKIFRAALDACTLLQCHKCIIH